MMTHSKAAAAALLALAILPACATTPERLHSESAVKRNIAAQAIVPSKEQKANVNIPADPTLRSAARERYKSGAVKKPVPVSTN
jgi:hypothetical protein